MEELPKAHNLTSKHIPHTAFVTILKYLTLEDIIVKFVCLSTVAREWVKAENYILYKHFIRHYNLHDRHKRYDIPAKTDMYSLIRDSGIQASSKSPSEALTPFPFETDGGTYNDATTYFIDKMFQSNNICHSTKIPKNANVQVYFGKKIDLNLDQINIKNYKPTSNLNYISIPFADSVDPEEEESYKLIKELNIHNLAWGYTCFVNAFAVFVSERKINIQSPVLSAFNNVTTIPGFEAMKFPIKQTINEADS
jgi:hypothetical protein